jgi:hypothetical protein
VKSIEKLPYVEDCLNISSPNECDTKEFLLLNYLLPANNLCGGGLEFTDVGKGNSCVGLLRSITCWLAVTID